MTPAFLSADQIAAAHRFFRRVGERTRLRGESYFKSGLVYRLEAYKRGVGFRASVSGGSLYRARLRYEGSEWAGECSCPVATDCKHCVATLMQAMRSAGGEAALAERAPAAVGLNAGAEDFASAWTKRLGRKLTAAERPLARVVDDLFTHYAHAEVVPEALLEPFLGEANGRGWNENTVALWPAAPESPWEVWLYVAGWLRRNLRSCPPSLAEVTDWADVDALVRAWERHEAVEKWRGFLLKAGPSRPGPATQPLELRVRLGSEGAQLEGRKGDSGEFAPIKAAAFSQLVSEAYAGRLPFGENSMAVWHAFHTGFGAEAFRKYSDPDCPRILNAVLRRPGGEALVAGPTGHPLRRSTETLRWRVEPGGAAGEDYRVALMLPDGSEPPPALALLEGEPSLYVTREDVLAAPALGGLPVGNGALMIPAEALESAEGVGLLDRIGVELPPGLAGRVVDVRMAVQFRCALEKEPFGEREWLVVHVRAAAIPPSDSAREQIYGRDGWQGSAPVAADGAIVRMDRSALEAVPALVEGLRLTWNQHDDHWQRQVSKAFPQQFTEWLASLPAGLDVELDPLLASLRAAPVRAGLKLEVEEADIDWFDLKVALEVEDTTLTKKEIKLLLDARGGFVRLGTKGWRRLRFELSSEEEAQLADLGLSAREFSSEPQRLHALQLAGKGAARRLLGDERAQAIERRAAEIKTRVSPPVPAALSAELRPYQLEGFHFLAYLTANRFGGILADDMGLGKTVQALAWLLWLRATSPSKHPCLVVCPKSVVDNWLAEARRFAPGLRVHVLARGSAGTAALQAARASADLIVTNYAQLRVLEAAITAAPWHAAILDEAQSIKNPESQTALAAYSLKASHRLALSGTPIENRLLDLWSIMAFVMPGVLGRRAEFGKNFDQRSDPLARMRLAARVRPFALRRTKSEVAKDLPERIEEDLVCEMDGSQATLYRAELKRARAALLKVSTEADLGGARFHILTSLLRLRQICCHPALAGAAPSSESAKLGALLELLEPLLAEGHKVLVFSQFVEMLSLIRAELAARDLRHFMLTGQTEERGALVAEFQESEGAAVFLISLRAGGFGLNLTAASYVVLYDPWWNPAVEAQAIDRTHRIGQKSQVIAYRLLVKNSIEEKIRQLQRQKSAMAADILGEENFARALSLEDFQFLLSE